MSEAFCLARGWPEKAGILLGSDVGDAAVSGEMTQEESWQIALRRSSGNPDVLTARRRAF